LLHEPYLDSRRHYLLLAFWVQIDTARGLVIPPMILFTATCPAQLDILTLLSGRAPQPRIQRFPDRRKGASFLRRYVVKAFSEGMRGDQEGPWRVAWQRRVWHAGSPEWAPLVVCGRYRLAVETLGEAVQIRAMLNWFRIPEPTALDRRGHQRGRRPRLDRRGAWTRTPEVRDAAAS